MGVDDKALQTVKGYIETRKHLGRSLTDHITDAVHFYESVKRPITVQPVERRSITEHPQWPLVAKEQWEAEQVLGKALGYPWYKDDPQNFPDATEADGVCTGEHTLVTIAMEAASRLKREAVELTKDELNSLRAQMANAMGDIVTREGIPHDLPFYWPAYRGEIADAALSAVVKRFELQRRGS